MAPLYKNIWHMPGMVSTGTMVLTGTTLDSGLPFYATSLVSTAVLQLCNAPSLAGPEIHLSAIGWELAPELPHASEYRGEALQDFLSLPWMPALTILALDQYFLSSLLWDLLFMVGFGSTSSPPFPHPLSLRWSSLAELGQTVSFFPVLAGTGPP